MAAATTRVLLTCAPSAAHQGVHERLSAIRAAGKIDIRVFPESVAAPADAAAAAAASPKPKIDDDALPVVEGADLAEALAAVHPHVLVVFGAFGGGIVGEAELALPGADALKAVLSFGAGYNSIDVAACRKRSIDVCNVPDAVTDASSDVALFLLLGTLRRAGEAMQHALNGQWGPDTAQEQFLGRDPRGLTLGVVGFGRIGASLAAKAAAVWGMKVLYHSRNRASAESEAACALPGAGAGAGAGARAAAATEVKGAEHVADLRELMARSDAVSVHVPLSPATRHLIGAEELAAMKPSAVLINTARGDVIDEAALCDALERRAIAGAGLDVTSTEPGASERLRQAHPNLIILPHIGSCTNETRSDMWNVTLDNIQAIHDGNPINVVN